MKLTHAIALSLALCALPVAASADAIMITPQIEHNPWADPMDPNLELVVTVEILNTFMLDSYTVAIDLVPRAGVDPAGLEFDGYTEAPANYIINDNVGIADDLFANRIIVDDGVAGATEEKTPGIYCTVMIHCDVDPDLVRPCNYYDLVLDPSWCAVLDENWDEIPLQLISGWIHIFPEPATLSLLALGGLLALKRRRG